MSEVAPTIFDRDCWTTFRSVFYRPGSAFGVKSIWEGTVDIDREISGHKLGRDEVARRFANPPGELIAGRKGLAGDEHSVRVVEVATGARGSYRAAMLARSMLRGADIDDIDPVCLSAGATSLLVASAKAIQDGRSEQEVSSLAQDMIERLHICASIQPSSIRGAAAAQEGFTSCSLLSGPQAHSLHQERRDRGCGQGACAT